MPNDKPLITVACLCERVLTENDGVMTLVRVVDQFTIPPAPEEVIERLNPHLVLTLVLMLKANGQVGKHQLTVQLKGGKEQEPRHLEIEFPDKPLGGANIVVQVGIGVVKNFGEKRFDISFDGELLTSVPFRVLPAQEQTTGTEESQES